MMVNGLEGFPKWHSRILLHKAVEIGTAELKAVGYSSSVTLYV